MTDEKKNLQVLLAYQANKAMLAKQEYFFDCQTILVLCKFST